MQKSRGREKTKNRCESHKDSGTQTKWRRQDNFYRCEVKKCFPVESDCRVVSVDHVPDNWVTGGVTWVYISNNASAISNPIFTCWRTVCVDKQRTHKTRAQKKIFAPRCTQNPSHATQQNNTADARNRAQSRAAAQTKNTQCLHAHDARSRCPSAPLLRCIRTPAQTKAPRRNPHQCRRGEALVKTECC